jgi:3-hydroxybutyryl-CoA dehydrogenase
VSGGSAHAGAALGERLGIVGSGTIACGLAACAARHGSVTLWARSDASAERAERSVAKVCSKFEEQLPPDRVRIATDLDDGLGDMTFVVEAISEELGAKRELFGRIGERLEDGAVLGTTTSSLPVATLAEASGRRCAA